MATDTKKILIDIEIQSNQLVQTKLQIEALKKQQAELKKETDYDRIAYEQLTQQIRVLNTESKKQQKEIDNNQKLYKAEKDSMLALEAEISNLTAKYKSLSKEQRNSAEGKELNKQINDLKSELGGANEGINSFFHNVGNYKNSIVEALGINTSFIGSLKNIGGAFLALVTNPIGAFMLVLSGIVYGLYKVFSQFKPIVDKIEQSFSALGATFSVVKNTIIDVFTGTKSLSEAFSSIGGEMKKATKDAINLKKAQQELEDSQAQLEISNKKAETQIQRLLLQSKNRSLSEKERQKLITDAMSLEEAQHKKNMEYASKEVENTARQIILGKNLTIQQKKDIYSGNIDKIRSLQDSKLISDEEVENYKNAILKKEDLNQKSIALQEKAQNRLDALAEAQQKKEEKRQAEREKLEAKKQKDYEDMLKRRNEIISLLAETEQMQIEKTNLIYKKAKEDIRKDTELDKTKLAFYEYRLEVEKQEKLKAIRKQFRENEFSLVTTEIETQYANEILLARNNQEELLALKKLMYETELKDAKQKQQDGVNRTIEEQQILERHVLESQAKIDETVNEQKKLSLDTQLNLALNNENLIFEAKRNSLNEQLKLTKKNSSEEAKLKKELFDLETANNNRLISQRVELAKQSLSITSDIVQVYKNNEDTLQKKYEATTNAKKESLQKQLDSGIITQSKYNKEVAKQDKELEHQKAVLARKQALRNRAIALANIAINTAEGISKAYGQTGIGGIPMSVIIGAMGAAQTAVVMSTEIPKASRGMMIGGRKHAQGGTLIEAEQGESIINARSTAMFRNELSAINEAGGGVKFSSGTIPKFQDGGFTSRNSMVANYATKQDVAEIIANTKIYVAIEDYQKAEKKYAKIVNSGRV